MKNFLKIFMLIVALLFASHTSYAKDPETKPPVLNSEMAGDAQVGADADQVASAPGMDQVVASAPGMVLDPENNEQVDLMMKLKVLVEEKNKLKQKGKTKEAEEKAKEIRETRTELMKLAG